MRWILPAPPYNDPSRETLTSLGTVLGGGFTSRLNQNLREAKGYTYGAGASYRFAPGIGYFVANSSVRADVTGPSIGEFLAEFKRLGAGDVSPVEAGKAASTRTADAVSAMGSLMGLLNVAATYELNGRPFSGFSEDIATLGALDAPTLNGIAARAMSLDRGLLVLVGDKATILKQISGLGLPAPIFVNPN